MKHDDRLPPEPETQRVTREHPQPETYFKDRSGVPVPIVTRGSGVFWGERSPYMWRRLGLDRDEL